MKRKLLALATVAISFASAAQADETIAIKPGFMLLSPSGYFGSTTNNVGSRIDMNLDLNFKNSSQATGEIDLLLGDSQLSFEYIPMSFSGSGTLARNITFNGLTFGAGTPATSTFKADVFDVGYTYYLVNMDDLPSRIQLGIETSVKTVRAKTSMTNLGTTTNKNMTIPIPTVGLRGRVALADFIGVTGRIGYLGYSGNTFTDASAQIEFSPLPTLGIFAGYRYIKLKLNNTGMIADMTLKGPFVGGFFRF
ncbi:hypothetical protein [Mariprofundus ferrooxydans]|uniref:Outer membrane protein n=1 Tax=Mariprofundus ferrooxydans PV-1 TaxID=314345 RepID=Q0F2F9_9PROT|nr:hypothetical protein [Mariprofundus ferrooxydans]EAU55591.1 hypothetical protein SPV1_01547 [Mariprofundus ferrooxydans PV-1]KON48671.1 hypothetical protein AL013_01490 [Mariprofundus ferrooxydans]